MPKAWKEAPAISAGMYRGAVFCWKESELTMPPELAAPTMMPVITERAFSDVSLLLCHVSGRGLVLA